MTDPRTGTPQDRATLARPDPSSNPSSTRADSTRPGRLALADGSVFHGVAFGAVGRGIVATAEVVFNTAISGYQESITDPSYTGQFLVATFPLIGIVGANHQDEESPKIQVSGLIVRELSRLHSNFRADESLPAYMARHGVLGLSDIDTRALTRKLRSAGVTQGALTDDASISDAQLVQRARDAAPMDNQNLVPFVGCSSSRAWGENLGTWTVPKPAQTSTRRYKVLALDCGAKANILRNLTDRGCDVTLAPHDISADQVLSMYRSGEIDGLFVSNGPGDPAAVQATIDTLRKVIGPATSDAIPTFGICLGHQLLALALGVPTYKMKFGHRGINHPILNTQTGRVEITSQNHGFAVDPDAIRAAGGEPTHIHLNDGTLAGFRMTDKPVFSVQYHPEASPGPHDAGYLFDQFVGAMARRVAGR
jgi:carbamoyl-phosphate synthase small subunit